MDSQVDVAVCALLAGIHTAVQVFHLTEVQVATALLSINSETALFLKQVKAIILAQARFQGINNTSQAFGISEEFIKLLCERNPVSRTEIDLTDSTPEVVLPPRAESSSEESSEADTNHFELIKDKVRTMYSSKIKIKLIAALFRISTLLVHSWGNFTRFSDRDRATLKRRVLQDKIDSGMSLPRAAKELKIPLSRAETLLGLCPALEASVCVAEDIKARVLQLAQVKTNLSALAKQFGITKRCITRWLQEESYEGGDNKFVKGDDLASAGTKKRCLETYYLTKDSGKSAEVTGLSREQVRKVVADFEGKVMQKWKAKRPRSEDDK